jgi:hypothetical protein
MHYVTSMVNIDTISKVPQATRQAIIAPVHRRKVQPNFQVGDGVRGELNFPTDEATPHVAKLSSGSEFLGDVGIPAYPLSLGE